MHHNAQPRIQYDIPDLERCLSRDRLGKVLSLPTAKMDYNDL